MLFFVIGLPGRFTEWCTAVAAALVGHAIDPCEVVNANTLGEISHALIRRGASTAIVATIAPGGRLCAAVIETGRRFLAPIDDPRAALLELVRGGTTVPEAVAAVASSCAAMPRYISAPGALRLRPDFASGEQASLIEAIAAHLDLATDDAAIREIAETLSSIAVGGDHGDARARIEDLSPEDRHLVDGALLSFVDQEEIGEFAPITWGRELFFLGDARQHRADRVIDLTGRARCLLHGPYVMLPPGEWSLTLSLLFSREALDHDFLIEVATDRQLASSVLRPAREGSFDAALDFAVDDSSDHPVVIRLSTQRAAFDGALALVGAKLRQGRTATAAWAEAVIEEQEQTDR